MSLCKINLLLFLMLSSASLCQTTGELESELSNCHSNSCKIEKHNILAWKYRKTDFENAKKHAKVALQLSEKEGFKEDQATALNRLGIVYKNQEFYDSAIYCYDQALIIEKSIQNTFGIARAYYQLSKVYKLKGDDNEALKFARLNLNHMRKAGSPKDIGNSYTNLAILLTRKGAYEKALENYNLALTNYENAGYTNGIANVYQDMGNLCEINADYAQAESCLKKALNLYRKLNNQFGEADVLNNLGNVYYYRTDFINAENAYQESVALKESLGDTYGLRGTFYNLSLITKSRGNNLEALSQQKRGLELASLAGDSVLIGKYYIAISESFEGLTQYQNAYDYLIKAYLLFKRNGNMPDLLLTCRMLSEVCSKLQDFASAYRYMQEYDAINLELEKEYRKYKSLELEIERTRAEKKELVKEKEINQTKLRAAVLEKRNNTYLMYVIIFGALLIVSISLLWVINYRQKQKLVLKEKDIKIKRQQFEDELKENELSYRTSVIEAQESERRRISEELHDHLGGLLSTVKLHFKSIEEIQSGIDADMQEPYNRANDLLDKACEEVRIIAHRMASAELDKFGLVSELQELIDTIHSSGQLQIDLNVHSMNERLPIALERDIYKTIRELITNIVKHAEANKVNISLIRHNGELTIMVEDDGIGFDPENVKMGLGLKQILQRFKTLKGIVNIDSGLGNGTTISIDLPIKKSHK